MFDDENENEEAPFDPNATIVSKSPEIPAVEKEAVDEEAAEAPEVKQEPELDRAQEMDPEVFNATVISAKIEIPKDLTPEVTSPDEEGSGEPEKEDDALGESLGSLAGTATILSIPDLGDQGLDDPLEVEASDPTPARGESLGSLAGAATILSMPNLGDRGLDDPLDVEASEPTLDPEDTPMFNAGKTKISDTPKDVLPVMADIDEAPVEDAMEEFGAEIEEEADLPAVKPGSETRMEAPDFSDPVLEEPGEPPLPDPNSGFEEVEGAASDLVDDYEFEEAPAMESEPVFDEGPWEPEPVPAVVEDYSGGQFAGEDPSFVDKQGNNTLALVSAISTGIGWIIGGIGTCAVSVFFFFPGLLCTGPIFFLGTLVGAITGHIGQGQIKETGEGGSGMAKTGIILGWLGVGISILLLCLIPLLLVLVGPAIGNVFENILQEIQ